ncbi:hypothetical protein AVEN_205697-1 [Araneus ventricosus]|uniref:Tc1-like transposase DDE domain-containing protein n=1 Tax=Araneus ventricosus TaxID=182803 RepID=A0A4Y2QV96_ARAVE|nr:hypothetical protein AVEN_205697-1 [Araneus ventricosus]
MHVCFGAPWFCFLFMDDNARPHRTSRPDEYLQSEDITRMDWPAPHGLESVEHVWYNGGELQPVSTPPVCRNFGGIA